VVDFDEFYRATSRRLLRYAFALCADLGTAQDLAQEAYVRAWQRWPRIGEYENPEAWLRLVVTRLSTDRLRRLTLHGRISRLRAPDPVPEPSVDTVMLTEALKRLPAAQRRAAALYYVMDIPVAEIAAETGASVGTVKSWLARARAALAASLLTEPTISAEGGNDAR
jgi:RNA polymerase sigma-70 factor (sigma-E family)